MLVGSREGDNVSDEMTGMVTESRAMEISGLCWNGWGGSYGLVGRVGHGHI